MATGQVHPVIRYIRKLAGAGQAGEASDARLLAHFIKERDESAFATLVERHGPMVLNICRRMLNDAHEVDDVFQAVFLVLVRKAGSVGKPELLANWLYGVACRTAAKARGQAYRRQARVKEMVDMPATDTTSDPAWQELRPLLDEELKTLPDKYRAPLVLCYLQGKTYTEAARILGWAEGTVSGRLARGREILRAKLTRRGITLSGVTLATLLAHKAASATLVPAALATNTVKAALLVAAGNTLAAGVISAPVATLIEGVLHAMFLTKLKIVAAVILAMGVLGMGGGAFTYNAWALGKGQDKEAKGNGGAKNDLSVKAPAPEGKEPAGIKQDSTKRTAKMRDILATEIKFDGATDAKQTLGEFLENLSDRYNLTFDVNESAFRENNVNDVLSTPIAERPLPRLNGIRLSTLLRKVLGRIPDQNPEAATRGATSLIRGDHIEITTNYALRNELGLMFRIPIGQQDQLEFPALLPLVVVSFDKSPIDDALKEIASATGYNIVIDSRKGDKEKAPRVTADLNNVPVDTAVRILADMADMGVAHLDNVLYVTTKENAEKLQKGKDKLKVPEAAKPGAGV